MPATCPVCSGAEGRLAARVGDCEYKTSDELFDYWECAGCGSLFLPHPPVDRLAEIYPENYYSYTAAGGGPVERVKEWLDARAFRGLLARLPDRPLRVLDVGGGSGWLLDRLRAVGGERIGETHIVDLDAAAAEEATAAGHVYHHGRIEDFSGAESFDLVLLLNLIEHVADPAGVLAKLRDRLDPAGLLLLKTPNVDTWDRRLFADTYWGGFHAPRHFVLFHRRSLVDLAGRQGLEVDRLWYTQGAPQWTCSLLAALDRRGWIDIRRDRPMYYHPIYPALTAVTAALDFLRLPFAPTAQMMATLRRSAG